MRNDIAVTKKNDLESAKNFTMVVYALQAASFFAGITFFIAVIINYVKLSDVRGTWLESHFRWQIRTFWFSILWAVVGTVLIFVLVGYLVLLAAGVWLIYRIAKGWLYLVDGKAMYA